MASRYKLSFTGVSLALAESVILAQLYLDLGDWQAVREAALARNLLQQRATASAKRVFQELPPRLAQLSRGQITLLASGSLQQQRVLLWLAICKRYALIREFAIDVLHDRFLTMAPALTIDDYERFYRRKADWHEELEALSDSTRHKLRTNLFRMMREAGLLNSNHEIIPVILDEKLRDALAPDAPLCYEILPMHSPCQEAHP